MDRGSVSTAMPASFWAGLAVCVLAGGALRLWAGAGGIWLDEAWSAVYAHDARTVMGVFASIHHDNNHHLNTLWLQLVGIGAPPLAMRALSIAASMASIAVAGAIGARRGAWPGFVTALLFAVSPFMVLYGSEARGYAPAMLAILVLIWLLGRWLDEGRAPAPAAMIAVAALGALAHLLMIPALLLLALWAWLARLGRSGPIPAATDAVRMLAPAFIACGTVAVIVLGGAYAARGGLDIGSYTSFSWGGLGSALASLVVLTTGAGRFGGAHAYGLLFAGAAVALLLVTPPRPRRDDALLWAILILAMPLAAAALQPGNTHFARYFLVSSIGLALLLGGRAGALIAAGGWWRRGVALALLAPIVVLSLIQDRDMTAFARGDPDLAVRLMRDAAPQGARLLVDSSRDSAVHRVAAAQQRYPLDIAGPDCAAADYRIVGIDAGAGAPERVSRCGVAWRLVAMRGLIGSSGQGWALYRAAGLQSEGGVANGPRPAR